MPSSSPSSSVVRQELLSAVVVAGRTLLNSTVPVSSATNNTSSSGIALPDAATSRPAIHHYELLGEEPSTRRVLQPRRARRGGNDRQNEGTKNCFPAPRQSDVHFLAIAPDILREVERELQEEEAEVSIRQEEES